MKNKTAKKEVKNLTLKEVLYELNCLTKEIKPVNDLGCKKCKIYIRKYAKRSVLIYANMLPKEYLVKEFTKMFLYGNGGYI